MKLDAPSDTYDYLLIGGGLQAGLIAMALRDQQPTASILLIEQADQLAGNHTWSFHPDDVPAEARPWVQPLIEHRWPACEVRISGLEKAIELPYASISSEHFAGVVSRRIEAGPGRIVLGQSVTEFDSHHVRTHSGETFSAQLVIDCRGPKREPSTSKNIQPQGCGFQKFWGFEIETSTDWPRLAPTIMDDAVDQTDGFRFVYSLPFTPRRILVEDTRFSNTPELDREECLTTVRNYLTELGVDDWSICREESGVLPMPYAVAAMPDRGPDDQVLAGGYAGGWFHPATGYSFPLAVAFADTVSKVPIAQISDRILAADKTRAAIVDLARRHTLRTRYARFLNRLLFCLVKPTTRYQIFRRFYQVLSPAAIARFYAHRFTLGDAFRIVVGVPPRGLQPLTFVRSFLQRAARANPRSRKDSSFTPVHPSARSEAVQ